MFLMPDQLILLVNSVIGGNINAVLEAVAPALALGSSF